MEQNKEYLDKLHNDILLIMDEIHRVCIEHHLRYYLIGGTLLGAVRHKGFIPWDDDLDIVMPREDFDKFIALAASELSSNFYLDWITTNKLYWLMFAKVCLKNTIFDDGKRNSSLAPGIFVDIFPLDFSGGYSMELDKIKRKSQRLLYIAYCRSLNSNSRWTIFYKFTGKFIPNRICFKLQRKVCMSAKQYGFGFYTNFNSQYNVKKQTMPIDWYGNGIDLPFEDRLYHVPSKYLNVIESIFGSNYMQLPPENKRRCHYPRKVKFSTSEVMEFDEPVKRVSVREQDDILS